MVFSVRIKPHMLGVTQHMEINTKDRLIADVHKFVSETGISEGRFGRLTVNDAKLIARLRAGKDVTTANLDKIYAFMDAERARRAGPVGAASS
jgi:hypothetical protein